MSRTWRVTFLAVAVAMLWAVAWSAYALEAERLFDWCVSPLWNTAISASQAFWEDLRTKVAPLIGYALLPAVFLVLAVNPNPIRAVRQPLVVLCLLLPFWLTIGVRILAAADVGGSLERWVATHSPNSVLGVDVLALSGPWYATVDVSWVTIALAALVVSLLMSWAVWTSGLSTKCTDSLPDGSISPGELEACDPHGDLPDGWVPCPRCGGGDLEMPSFTWWGGVVGKKLLNHVVCRSCRATFTAKSGKSNTRAIIIYEVVMIAIVAGILTGTVFLLAMI